MSEFADLPQKEQEEKLNQIKEAVKKHGLKNITAEIVDQLILSLGTDSPQRKKVFSIEGKEDSSLKSQVDSFRKELKVILHGVKNFNEDIECTVVAGGPYSTIKDVVDCSTKQKVNLEHDGQVWLIDFWATWCPPCQKPMAHNQEMLTKNGAKWKGKARIIGISIDDGVDTVNNHVKNKGWGAVEHFHQASSSCSEDYGVKGVPHVMLIDSHGKIVFKGHPATRPNLEADIDTLISGGTLTGEGTSGGSGEGSDDPAFKKVEDEVVESDFKKFQEEIDALKKDSEFAKHGKEMARAMSVLFTVKKFDFKSPEHKTRYEMVNVLVGSQANIDYLTKQLDQVSSKLSGKFEKSYRTQAH